MTPTWRIQQSKTAHLCKGSGFITHKLDELLSTYNCPYCSFASPCSLSCCWSCSRGPQISFLLSAPIISSIFNACFDFRRVPHLQGELFKSTPQPMQRPWHIVSHSDFAGISRWIVSRKYFERSTSFASRGKCSLSSKSMSNWSSASSVASAFHIFAASAPSTTPKVCWSGSFTGDSVRSRLNVAKIRSATGHRHLQDYRIIYMFAALAIMLSFIYQNNWTIFSEQAWYNRDTVRYVDINWFICHVLQFLLIKFKKRNLCYIRKSAMKYQQKSDWKSNLPWFSCTFPKCMFVDFLTEYIGPPNCVRYWIYSSS